MGSVKYSNVEIIAHIFRTLAVSAAALLSSIGPAQSAEVVVLQLNPSQSWVQDSDWFEVFSDAQGEIPPLYYGTIPFGYSPPKGTYHAGQRIALSGTIKLILGGAYPISIELNDDSVVPGLLPSGDVVDLRIGPLTLQNGVFPNDLFTLPDGSFCACVSSVDPFAPRIGGSFDGQSLMVEAQFSSNTFSLLPVVDWIGSPPSSNSNFAISRPAFHLEATVVPVPSAIGLFGSAFGLFVMHFRRRLNP